MLLTQGQKEQWQILTKPEIMKIYSISPATVNRWSKENNIKPKRKKGSGAKPGPTKEIKCKNCNIQLNVHVNSTRKYCSRSCASSFISKNIDRSYMQSDNYRNIMRKDNTPAYKKYAGRVHRLTRHTYEKYKNEINPYGHKRTLCGVENGYQLDHIIPIKFGFENNIPPEVLAEKNNLRMLPWKENLMRNYSKN